VPKHAARVGAVNIHRPGVVHGGLSGKLPDLGDRAHNLLKNHNFRRVQKQAQKIRALPSTPVDVC